MSQSQHQEADLMRAIYRRRQSQQQGADLILGLGMALGLMFQALAVEQARAQAPLAHVWLLMVVS